MESRDGAMRSWSTCMAHDNDSQKNYNASLVQQEIESPSLLGLQFIQGNTPMIAGRVMR